MIEARDRVASALGGHGAAHRVFSAMLRNGAFVAEARRELHASTHGQPVDEASLRAMVAALADGPALTSFLTDLRQALLAWHGHVLTRAQVTSCRRKRRWVTIKHVSVNCAAGATKIFRGRLGSTPLVVRCTAHRHERDEPLQGLFASCFPSNALPTDGGWPAGCGAPKRSKNADEAKLAYIDGLEACKADVVALFEDPQHRWWATWPRRPWNSNQDSPTPSFLQMPTFGPSTLDHPLPVAPPEGSLCTGASLQLG